MNIHSTADYVGILLQEIYLGKKLIGNMGKGMGVGRGGGQKGVKL
jgi:hypothetical protein